MAIVALEFQNDKILVAAARVSAKRQKIQHLFSVDLSGDDNEAAESLKSALNDHGLTKSDAIVVVSRADAEMREMSVPPAPDSELPEMVRFLARSEFASLNENWQLDFVPLTTDPDAQRVVLAAGISPEFQKQINQIVEPSGLKVKHMVLRPFASIDLVSSRLSDDKCRLIVGPSGDQTDLSVVAGGDVVATRTVRIPATLDLGQRADATFAEVRRTIASSRKSLGEKQIGEVMVLGSAEKGQPFAELVKEKLELDTGFVEPLTMTVAASALKQPDDASQFAGLLGALVHDAAGARHAIDFLNPRRPVVKKTDYSKWIVYGSLGVVAALVMVAVCFYTLNTQANEIAVLNSDLSELKRQTSGKKGTPSVEQIVGEVDKIDQWNVADINWLEALFEYSQRSLTPDDAIVDLFDAETGLRANVAPRVVINTRISEVKKESELINELGDRVFSVKTTRGAIDEEDKEYPLSTSFRVTLKTEAKERIKRVDDLAKEYVKQRKAARAKPESDDKPSADGDEDVETPAKDGQKA